MLAILLNRVILLTLLVNVLFINLKAQVKIGNNSTNINAASLLELETTDKGFVLPRVSINDVTLPAPLASGLLVGTIVYNTNTATLGGSGAGVYFWNGSWVYLTNSNSSSTAWNLTGNSGTSIGSNFLGTTDNVDVAFRTSNTEALRIKANGRIGIGTTSPGAKLEVNGTFKLTDGSQGLSKVLTSDASGLANWQAIINTLNLSGNTITSTVNGVATTANTVSSVSNTSSVNNLSTSVNGVTGSTVPIINSNTNSWTQAGGLTTTVNGVSSSITPASGTIATGLGYNSAGTPVYQPIVDFYATNTSTYTAITSNNTQYTDTHQSALVNKGGGTFTASTNTYTTPVAGVYEVETRLRYNYTQATNSTLTNGSDIKIYYATLLINGTYYFNLASIPYSTGGGVSLANYYCISLKEVVSLPAGAAISPQASTFSNALLYLSQFRTEYFHVKKVD